jgi:WD40 repeat protein
LSLDWDSNNEMFAAGCANITEPEESAPNRPCNMITSSADGSRVDAYSRHSIQTSTKTLYATVSKAKFATYGEPYLYTASYDKTVRIWDFRDDSARAAEIKCIALEARVDDLDTSLFHDRVAVGTQKEGEKINVFSYRNTSNEYKITAKLSTERSNLELSLLRWGVSSSTKNLLVSGFTDPWYEKGDLKLWDLTTGDSQHISPHAQAVFDIIWHEEFPIFAAAMSTFTNSSSFAMNDPKTKTFVRIYDPLRTGHGQQALECPARDLNELAWSRCANYVAAGCTDGNAYVWDRRKGDLYLHRFQQNPTLRLNPTLYAEQDPRATPEEQQDWDSGISFTRFHPGLASSCISPLTLVTGGSDGMVKAWDIRQNPEDAMTSAKTLVDVQNPISSAAFSSFGESIVVGDDYGSISLFSVTPGYSQSRDIWKGLRTEEHSLIDPDVLE